MNQALYAHMNKKKKKKYPGVSQANWMHVGLVSSWCRLHGTKKSIDSKKKGFSSYGQLGTQVSAVVL
jgi:hypothetical protein